MHLYLVQHAEARPREEDPQRPMSKQGQADILKVAVFLAEREAVKASRILHSGKLRAEQTAEILAEYLHPDSVSATDGLNPLDDPALWAGRLKETDEDLMLVGHLPHMSNLAALLLIPPALGVPGLGPGRSVHGEAVAPSASPSGSPAGLAQDEDKPIVAFRNAGVVCLGRDEAGAWSLRWAVTPQILP